MTEFGRIREFLHRHALTDTRLKTYSAKTITEIAEVIEGRIHESSPTDGAVANYTGLYFRDVVDDDETARHYFLLATQLNDPHGFHNLAHIHYGEGREDLAERGYMEAVKRGSCSASGNLADLYLSQGRDHLAEWYYLVAIERGCRTAPVKLGSLYEGYGRMESAERYYLMGALSGCRKSLNRLWSLYEEQGLASLAGKYRQMFLDAQTPDGINDLGVEYYDEGFVNEAEECYLLAVARGSIPAMDNLGSLYEAQEKEDLAEEYYLRALAGGDPDAGLHLRDLYRKWDPLRQYWALCRYGDRGEVPTETKDQVRRDLVVLRRTFPVRCFENKIRLLGKRDTCPICYEEDVVTIPRECVHYYCRDCYVRLSKCALCEN